MPTQDEVTCALETAELSLDTRVSRWKHAARVLAARVRELEAELQTKKELLHAAHD